MAEKVITEFELELGQFETKLQQAVEGMEGYDAAASDAAKSNKELSGSLGSASDRMAEMGAMSKVAAQGVASVNTEAKTTPSIFTRALRGVKDFAAGAKDGFKQAIASAGGFKGITKQLGDNFKALGSQVSGAFQSIGQEITNIGGKVPVIGGLLQALGPVGIAAGAVGSALLGIAKNTDFGATAIDGFSRAATLALDRITGTAKNVGNALADAFESAGKRSVPVFGNVANAAKGLFAVLSPGVALINKLFGDDIAEGQKLAQRFDDLADLQSEVNLKTAQNEPLIRKNLAALRDTTKPVEERLRLADELTAIEEQNLALRVKALRTERDIVIAQAAQQQARKGEIDDAIKFRINELTASIAQAEADSVSLTERVAVRRNQIVQEEENRKAALRQKGVEAYKKQHEEIAKADQQRAAAEKSIDDLTAKLAEDRLARRRTQEEQEVAVVEDKYAKLITATEEGYAKLASVTPQNQQSDLVRREAETIIAIEQAKNEELAALEAKRAEIQGKTREEALEKIRTALLTETELQREAILQQLDEQTAYAEQYIADEEERAKVIAELKAKAEAELLDVTKQANAEQLAEEQRAADELLARQKQTADTLGEFATGLTTIIAASATGNQELAANASKAIIDLALQTAEKLALVAISNATVGSLSSQQSIATGGTLGLVQAALLTALIKGTIGVLRAQIAGAYTGERSIGMDGERPIWSGKDGYLRRVHKGEDIIASDKARQYRGELDAIHDGRLYEYIQAHSRVHDFIKGDTGQRMAASVMLAPFYDKNIVDGLNRSRQQEREQTELLAVIAERLRGRSSRYY